MNDIKAGAGTGTKKMSTHDVGLAGTLLLGETLQRLPQQIVILGLDTGGDSDWQYSQQELARLVAAIRMEMAIA